MSVQIEYEGEDDDSAWILPVPVPPELSVGSDALFEALEFETEPRFRHGDHHGRDLSLASDVRA